MGVGEASLAVVLDVGHVAVVTVHDVSDGLAAAVGEVYAVHALGVVTVAAFPVVEVVAGGGVPDSPLEVVLGPGELVRLEGLEGVTLKDKEDSCESVVTKLPMVSATLAVQAACRLAALTGQGNAAPAPLTAPAGAAACSIAARTAWNHCRLN